MEEKGTELLTFFEKVGQFDQAKEVRDTLKKAKVEIVVWAWSKLQFVLGRKEEERETFIIELREANSISQESSREIWVNRTFWIETKWLRLEANDPLIRREFERLQRQSLDELRDLCIEIIGDLSWSL